MAAKTIVTLLLTLGVAAFAGCLEDDPDESREGDVVIDGEVREDAEDVDRIDLECERTDGDSGTCTYDVDS